jgi:hypothetical protein
VLAPWAYIASVLYHDTFWYPFLAKKHMDSILNSDWARLFQNWEHIQPDREGFPHVGEAPLTLHRTGLGAAARSFGILGTCLKEAPEFINKRRR